MLGIRCRARTANQIQCGQGAHFSFLSSASTSSSLTQLRGSGRARLSKWVQYNATLDLRSQSVKLKRNCDQTAAPKRHETRPLYFQLQVAIMLQLIGM